MLKILSVCVLLGLSCSETNGRNIFENNPFLNQGNNQLLHQHQATFTNPKPQVPLVASQIPFQIVSINNDQHDLTGTNQLTNFVLNVPAQIDNQLDTLNHQHPNVPSLNVPAPLADDPVGPRGKCLRPRGQFPSSKCNKFVNCWDGLSVEQYCPQGLLFNPTNNGFCDYAYNVNCHGKPIEVPPHNPSHPAPGHVTTLRPPGNPNLLSKCLAKRGLFPSTACNKFVNCWDGYAVEQDCPPGLVFSPKGYCDYPYNVNCHNRPIIQSDVPAVPQVVPVALPAGQHDAPAGQHVVPAGPQVVSAGPQVVPADKPSIQYDPVYPDPGTSTQVFVDVPSVPTFPPGITPPPISLPTASLAWTVPSVTPPSVTIGLVTTQDPNLIKKCGTQNGLFASTACNKYANCWDGYAVEQSCPPALVFSDKGYCDFPANVDCNSRPVDASFFATVPSTPSVVPVTESLVSQKPQVYEDETATKPNQAQANITSIKECNGVRGLFVTKSCSTYLECWDGLGTERQCPPGLYFSAKSGYCDYRHKVDCQDRSVESVSNFVKSECLVSDGTFRNTKNCSQYYVCQANTVTSRHECPNGLKFNDVIGVCDYAYRVDCTRQPYIHQLNKNLNTLQKVPAGLIDRKVGCVPGRLFKLNVDCNSVAICRNEVTEVVTCPQGMSYDTPTDRCTHPQLARCQDFL